MSYELNGNNLAVIIPAYNEAESIAGVINEIRSVAVDGDILVINDGSQDRTEEIASELGVRVINLPYHMGYGAALQTGFKYAMRNGYQYVVQMDGDGQDEPGDIPKLLKVVLDGEADVAIGSRFLNGGRYKAPLIRKMGMLVSEVQILKPDSPDMSSRLVLPLYLCLTATSRSFENLPTKLLPFGNVQETMTLAGALAYEGNARF